MFAITHDRSDNSGVLTLSEVPMPIPGPEQILVRVKATALNRADLLQRRGKYPPPSGESSILGLEIAGEVAQLGANVTHFHLGQRVFGLVGGGAYAEYCLIDQGVAMPIPDEFTFEEAAAIAEAFLTASEAVFTLGDLQPGNAILIHAGASGIGTAAIQLAHFIGAKVYTTVGSAEKTAKVRELGADEVINYKETDFAMEIKKITQNQGVDVIVDFIGANYLMRNLASLKTAGRLICVGLMGGTQAEINLDMLQKNRLQIKGLIMRRRSIADKRFITHSFYERWFPLLKEKKIFPVIDSVFPLHEAEKAHKKMEENKNIGKIVLRM